MNKIFVNVAFALLLSGCALLKPVPGKEKEAEAGFKASKPVIEALEKYHLQNKKYPTELAQLVPIYLKQIDNELFYQLETDSYVLSFLYTGWGISNCEYRPDQEWNCKTKY